MPSSSGTGLIRTSRCGNGLALSVTHTVRAPATAFDIASAEQGILERISTDGTGAECGTCIAPEVGAGAVPSRQVVFSGTPARWATLRVGSFLASPIGLRFLAHHLTRRPAPGVSAFRGDARASAWVTKKA